MVEIPIIGTTEPAATVRALRDAAPAGASPLTVEWDGLLCVITMTRPAVRNAVDLALALEIEKAVDGRTIEQHDAADVRTLADGWAYARFYESTARRNAARLAALLQSPPSPFRHRRPAASHQTTSLDIA